MMDRLQSLSLALGADIEQELWVGDSHPPVDPTGLATALRDGLQPDGATLVCGYPPPGLRGACRALGLLVSERLLYVGGGPVLLVQRLDGRRMLAELNEGLSRIGCEPCRGDEPGLHPAILAEFAGRK